MKKKLLSLCLALVLVLGCLPLSASAGEAGGVTFQLDQPQEVTVYKIRESGEPVECQILGTFTAPKTGLYRVVSCATTLTNAGIEPSIHIMGSDQWSNYYSDIGFMKQAAYKANRETVDDNHVRYTTFEFARLEGGKNYQIGYDNFVYPDYASKFVSYPCEVTIFSADSQMDNYNADGTASLTSSTEYSAESMDGTKAWVLLYRPEETGWYAFTNAMSESTIMVRKFNARSSDLLEKDFLKQGGVKTALHLTAGTDYYTFCPFGVSDSLSVKKIEDIPTISLDTPTPVSSFMNVNQQYLAIFTPPTSGYYSCSFADMETQTGSISDIEFFNETTGESVLWEGSYNNRMMLLQKENSYSVKVLGSDFSFRLEWKGEIGPPLPTLTGTVNITGTEKFGQTLRASVSGGNSPSNAFTYTWKRGGSAIATGAAYTLTETDVGQTLTCEVTASDRSGFISKTTGVIGRAAGPAAPAGLKGVCPTAADTTDGKITGTTTAMEYSTDRNFASPAGTPCSANETTGLAPGTYYVRVAATTSTEAGSVTTVTVPVYVAPEVTSILVSPASGLVLKGYTRQYIATVNGKGAYDKTVTWSVTGGTAGTSISSTGLLTVSADEELSTVLTITATSVGDNTKTGTATVTVAEYIPTPPIGGGDTPDEPENPAEPTVETETAPDGTVTTTTTWPDGKKAVQENTPDGGAKVEVTSSTGETIAKIDLPADPGEGKNFEDVKEGAWYEGAVDKATAYGLFSGTSDTAFTPDGSMTRGMVAQVLYNLSGKTGYGAGSGNFTDVTAGKWYENAIDWAAKAEIVSGMGGGKFDPDRAVTREQLVTMLYRYAQAIGADTKASMGLGSFPDSGEVTDYAETAMKWAVAEGFISGREQSDGNYIVPKGTATRAEVAAILTRFVEFLK